MIQNAAIHSPLVQFYMDNYDLKHHIISRQRRVAAAAMHGWPTTSWLLQLKEWASEHSWLR